MRHRLECTVYFADLSRPPERKVVLNEIVVDRGASPYLTKLGMSLHFVDDISYLCVVVSLNNILGLQSH